MKRPDNLIYGLNERPPTLVMIVLGLQHVFVMSSTLILPVIIVKEIGGSLLQIQAVVSLSMIAAGVGTIIQALRFGPIGSGYLVPNLCGPSYLGVSLQAAWLGGLPLMHGMTIVAGIFETLFSRILNKIKFLFPAEITGLVILMVAITLIPLGTSRFMGINYSGDMPQLNSMIVAVITLGTMVGINIWSRGKLRLYCVLIGMLVGYICSAVAGLLPIAEFDNIIHSSLFAIPGLGAGIFHWSFKWSLVLPFCIVSLCAALKSFGNISTAQKINDANWKKPDTKNIGNGLFADGLSIISSGLLGAVPTDTSASNVGLSLATAATSKYIAFTAGFIYIALGFLPKIAVFFSIMPQPVMGAILIYVTSFMILSGLQIILHSEINVLKIFVIGISFIFGVSADIFPGVYHSLPMWIQPVVGSSLTFATIIAILLNQILRIGSKKEAISSK